MATTTERIDEITEREIERALRLPCDFEDCLGQHLDPATWLVEVSHGWRTHETERIVICSKCRDGLHRARHEQITCPVHGPLGISVAAWWRPVSVI